MSIPIGDFVLFDHLRKRFGQKTKSKAKVGWFKDPRGEAPYRHWDGSRWTEETSESLPLPATDNNQSDT